GRERAAVDLERHRELRQVEKRGATSGDHLLLADEEPAARLEVRELLVGEKTEPRLESLGLELAVDRFSRSDLAVRVVLLNASDERRQRSERRVGAEAQTLDSLLLEEARQLDRRRREKRERDLAKVDLARALDEEDVSLLGMSLEKAFERADEALTAFEVARVLLGEHAEIRASHGQTAEDLLAFPHSNRSAMGRRAHGPTSSSLSSRRRISRIGRENV